MINLTNLTATVTSGGLAPFSYSWTITSGGTILSGATSQTAEVEWTTGDGWIATVTITDANGCVETQTFEEIAVILVTPLADVTTSIDTVSQQHKILFEGSKDTNGTIGDLQSGDLYRMTFEDDGGTQIAFAEWTLDGGDISVSIPSVDTNFTTSIQPYLTSQGNLTAANLNNGTASVLFDKLQYAKDVSKFGVNLGEDITVKVESVCSASNTTSTEGTDILCKVIQFQGIIGGKGFANDGACASSGFNLTAVLIASNLVVNDVTAPEQTTYIDVNSAEVSTDGVLWSPESVFVWPLFDRNAWCGGSDPALTHYSRIDLQDTPLMPGAALTGLTLEQKGEYNGDSFIYARSYFLGDTNECEDYCGTMRHTGRRSQTPVGIVETYDLYVAQTPGTDPLLGATNSINFNNASDLTQTSEFEVCFTSEGVCEHYEEMKNSAGDIIASNKGYIIIYSY